MSLIVGFDRAVITPSLDRPVYLAGFGQNRRAESIHDDLFACSLALSDGVTTCALVALDLIGFFSSYAQDVVESVHARYPEARILIASVHPHHGPDTLGLWGPDMKTSGVDAEYMHGLKEKITRIILASLEHLAPAELKVASIHVPGLAKNARNPEIVDDELTLAQFVGVDGRPLVSLFDFPCHPEVLWEHNLHITADYVGQLRAYVQAETGEPCIFFAGALGGMMTPDVVHHSFEEAELMGAALAQHGIRALSEAPRQADAYLSFASQPISAKVTNILYKLAFSRKLIPDLRDSRGYIHADVSLIRMGGLWLAAVPGELLPVLGLRLKASMKEAGAAVAGVIGLANHELGYMLPPEDFKYPFNPFRPGKHYEETNSIGKSIAPAVMAGLEELIQGAQHV